MAGPDGLASWRMEHTTASALCVTRANHPGRRPTRYNIKGKAVYTQQFILSVIYPLAAVVTVYVIASTLLLRHYVGYK